MPNSLASRFAAPWLRLSMRAKGAVLIAIPLAALLLALCWFAYLERQQESAEQWTLHTQQVQLRARELLTLLIDGQSAIRGYALTGREEFLESYWRAQRAVPAVLAELKRLVADDPVQSRRVAQLEPVIRERMAIMDSNRRLEVEALAHPNLRRSAAMIAGISQSKLVMDECRRQLATVLAEEERLLEVRTDRLHRQRQLIWMVFLLSGTLAIAGGWIAAGLFASGITVRLGALGENARRLAGREPLFPPMLGTDEISRLDGEMHRMAEMIDQRERALGRSEERFRTLVSASTQILWTTNADGMVAEDIPSWRAYTGQTLAEVQGLGGLEAIHPEDRERTAAAWAKAVAERGPYDLQYRLRREDGVYGHFAVRGVPVREHGEVREWIGSCTDISDRVEIDRMKDEFVTTVSHELRTPLASLRGFTELMLTREFSQGKRREFLSIIQKESKRLSNLINDFLDLQRIESGQQRMQSEDFDVCEVLRDAEQLFAPGASAHEFRIHCDERLPKVHADRDRTAQILANLVSNAVKYSPAGGVIEISARQHDGQVQVAVKDQGVGVPAEKVPNLFRKFYRVDSAANREIGGTGLGLALVKQIAEMQGGNVGVETIAGTGSTFWFTLPLSDSDEVRESMPSGAAAAVDILLVEDDMAFAELLREHFKSLGMSMLNTAYGERAIALAHAAKPRLILIDIYLRGALCGWDLLSQLKSDPELQDIPAVVVTISEPNVRGLVLGGAEYLSKAAEPEAFRAVISRHLKGAAGPRVLIVDDDPVFRRRVKEFIGSVGGFHVEEAENGEQGLARIEACMPDLLLLDLAMPGLDGFEVLRRLRADSGAVNLQVLVVTARDLSLEEMLYLRRSMATLVGKGQATLEHFTAIVEKAIGLRPEVLEVQAV